MKKISKLSLGRETLRLLLTGEQTKIVGAFGTIAPNCPTGIHQCGASSPPATCPPP